MGKVLFRPCGYRTRRRVRVWLMTGSNGQKLGRKGKDGDRCTWTFQRSWKCPLKETLGEGVDYRRCAAAVFDALTLDRVGHMRLNAGLSFRLSNLPDMASPLKCRTQRTVKRAWRTCKTVRITGSGTPAVHIMCVLRHLHNDDVRKNQDSRSQ